MVVSSTHDSILFFTDRGRVFQLKAYEVPEADRTARGVPIINLINVDAGEVVTAIISSAAFADKRYLAMATTNGEIKKVTIDQFESVRSSGLIAMDLEPGDELGFVSTIASGDELILITEQGSAARFKESVVPARSRAAGGVRSMRLRGGDRVAAMEVVDPNGQLLLVTVEGYAKRTPLNQFASKGRGIQGMMAIKVNDRSGNVACARVVHGSEEAMVISSAGTVLRTLVSTVSVQGRPAGGVQFMALRPGERVACVALLNGNGEAKE